MARRIERWLSLDNLADRASMGKRYQLSSRVINDAFYVYYRELGLYYWHPVASEKKKTQLSYSTANLSGLLRRVSALSMPFEFVFNGIRFTSGGDSLTCLGVLAERFNGLNAQYREMLCSVLGLPVDGITIEAIADRILYEFGSIDTIAQGIVRTTLAWPDELPVFNNAPCTIPKGFEPEVFSAA